ncbi:cadherin-like beta sandwich domain-containing protein [Mucilaginibacter pedocola]|uniref:Fibronectin type-III domain-containing protein n=1 Tax=Mucilaginibacter pedocola TaxID=1792845 RepID=A0A1S9PG88_9SPHI|nr:cadherin-like beta sandwich domain-containing protein [Mucilaginibacter pedocola]OOQ59962.1 hypothetical protein BC343_27815 [Mucilaginibacter pedocola]
MKRNLLLWKSSLIKSLSAISAAFLLLVLLGSSTTSRAQVVYSMAEPGNTSAATAGDLIQKMNYDGTNVSTIITGTNAGLIQPLNVALDGNNNRIFVSEGNLSGNVIKVITGSSVTNTITSANSAYIKDINYDVVGNWLYYITEGGDITQVTANDALYRVHPDGTGTQTLAASITKNPYRLEVDAANNKVYVVDVSFSGRSIKTVDLANNNTVTSRSFATSLNSVYDVALDKVTGYLYYCAEGGSAAALSATDQVRRQNIDGTNDVQIAASVCNSPFRLGLDAGNNRLYVGDAYYGTGKIVAINLTDNTFSTVISFTTGQYSPQINDFGVPDRPNVTTASANSIAATSATLGGTLVYGYGLSTERGVVYSSSNSTPTVSDTKVSMVTNTSNAAYSASVTGLNPSTTYYARAYAVNGAGTVYGSVVSFSTPSNDANLSAFTISSGTLTPTFAAATTSYTASVTNATTSVTVTPTRNNANATIKVNGTTVTSGTASGNLNLAIGNNTITTVVTAGDGATTKTYTLTVNRPQAAQTITFAGSATKTYGDADYAPGATASSGLTVSYASSNTAVATIVSGQIRIVGAGTTNITASQAGDANTLAATSVVQTLIVNKNAITVTATAGQTKVYGNADPTFAYTVTGGTVKSGDTFSGTLSRAAGTNVGNYAITIGTLALNTSNYTLTLVSNDFAITKRPLELTPTAQTKAYGDDEPLSYTYQFTGGTSLATGDGMTGVFTRPVGEIPGVYPFSIGTKRPVAIANGAEQSGNYNVTFVSTNLTITKRPITLKPQPATKVYGNADPTYPYQFVVGSVAPGEGMTGTFGRATGEDAGTYALTLGSKRPVNVSTGAATDQYYTISFIPENLTITKRTVNVTANTQSKNYGDADPDLTYSTDALGFSDTFSGSLTRVVGETVGTYAISQGTLALNATNYNLNFAGSNLTIGKKTINVTADAKTKNYGDADPALTYTTDALANGDSFTGALTRAAGESFGAYAISQGNLALNSNYTLNFTGGSLTINKKTINVTAAAQTKTYGDADPALTYTADALLGGDTFTGAITRAPGETFGNYAIGQGTLALNSNYAINFIGANLAIGKRPIRIDYYGAEVPYGSADQTIGYAYIGTLASGDSFSGSLGREPGSAVGTYAVNMNTLAVTNSGSYDITLNAQPYKIIPREIQVIGGPIYKTYGDPDPALTYSIYSGSLLSGTQITGALERVAGETAGPYNIGQGTLAINDSNYKLTYLGGYFEIDRAPLTVAIDSKTKVATKPNPPLTYSISGFKNGDTESVLSAPIQLVTDANINSGAGSYNIYNINSSTSINYNVNINGGILTVTPASSINTLASATLNGGGFDTAFDPATEFYSVNIPNGSTSATLVATVTDPLSTLSVGAYPAIATPLASGAPYVIAISNNQSEQVGLHVTAEDGSIKSYYFNVNPIPSDARLSNLTTSVGIIAPSFNPNVTNYSLDVSAETESVTITPTAHDPHATARVNGEGGGVGARTVSVIEGINPKSITVKSADGTNTTFYTLLIKRPIRLVSLDLSAGNLFPAFDPNVTSYVAKVPFDVPAISVTPKGKESYFNLYVNGDYVNYGDASAPVTINADGSTTITVKIVAGDGETSKTYSINVQHASNDATLAGISLSSGSLDPAFDPATLTYNVYLPNSTTAFSFTPATTDANATVTVNNAPLAHGDAVTESNLTVGLHNYYMAVTAADGVTAKNYLLSVSRPASSEPGLSNILTSAGTLSPAFDPMASPNYDIAVPAGVESVTITPVLIDTTATLQARLNGHNLAVGDSRVLTVPLAALYNTLVITNTAQDGTTQAIYTLTITRPQSADNTLSALTASIGTFRQPFSSSRTFYQILVPSNATNIMLSPEATSNFATIKVNGVTVAKGMSSQSLQLTAAANFFPVQVTAEDGTVNTINVLVEKASTNANLFSLTTNAGALNPAFDKNVLNYSMAVSGNVSSIKVTAGIADTISRIKINGAPAQSYSQVTVLLALGSNLVSVVVTPQEGAEKTYTINVTRVYGTNASLAALTVDQGALSPAFSGAVTSYNVPVASTVSTVQIHPTVSDANAKISVGDSVYTSATPVINYPVVTGTNTIVVRVTADDGTTIKNYTLNIKRAASPIANLSQLYLVSPSVAKTNSATGPGDYNYTASVTASTHTIRVVAAATDAGATIKVNGVITTSGATSAPIVLGADSTFITVQVTAANNFTVKSYVIKVLRPVSAVATLSQLYFTAPSVAKTSVNTGAGDFNYTASVPGSINNIKVVAVASDTSATIRVNGVITASGETSAPLTLNADSTFITVQVTAANNTTIKTYVIKVTKEAVSSMANLSKLYLVSPAVTKTNVSTGPAEYNSTASVSATTKTIKVVAVATDTTATIRVNGVITASGVASAPVTLTVGDNVINIVVTAQNGTTTHSWAIIVNKPAPPIIAAAMPNRNQVDMVQKPDPTAAEALPEAILVKQAVSPNGDGINDRFTIEGITAFPENTVRVMNRNGDVVYEAKGYDNQGTAFDGHGSKGTMQQPGTYFYSIEYKKGAETLRKTGYLVLKY